MLSLTRGWTVQQQGMPGNKAGNEQFSRWRKVGVLSFRAVRYKLLQIILLTLIFKMLQFVHNWEQVWELWGAFLSLRSTNLTRITLLCYILLFFRLQSPLGLLTDKHCWAQLSSSVQFNLLVTKIPLQALDILFISCLSWRSCSSLDLMMRHSEHNLSLNHLWYQQWTERSFVLVSVGGGRPDSFSLNDLPFVEIWWYICYTVHIISSHFCRILMKMSI